VVTQINLKSEGLHHEILDVLRCDHSILLDGVVERSAARWRIIPWETLTHRCFQSARSYSLPHRQWQQQQQQQPLRPFIRPLLQDFHRDFMHEVMSQERSANEENQGDYDVTDDILDFLPWYVLQDETKQCMTLITKATRQYVYGDTRGDPKVNVPELMKVIHDEYREYRCPRCD
jgi:uncharacterized Zn finger protein